MQTSQQKSSIPLPKNDEKRLVQAEVNKELFDACHGEMKKKGLKIRQVLEFGLRSFLVQSNPQLAKKMGLV